jgi:DNA repair exonuclease SbcCD ATPase subunit
MAEVNVKVGMNNSAFSKGLDSMKSQAKTWASDVGKMFVGAFAFQKVISSISNFASELDRVGKLATRLDVLPSTIERIGHAARISGTDVEVAVKAMSRLTIESMKSSESFAKLGIDARAFSTADIEQQLVMLAQAYQDAQGDTEKMIALNALLGARAQELIPLLKQGPDAMQATMGEAADGYDNIVRLTEGINDFFSDVTRFFKSTVVSLMGQLQKEVLYILGFIEGGTKKAKQNVKDFNDQTKAAAEALKLSREAGAKAMSMEDAKKSATEAQKAFQTVADQLAQRALERMDLEGQILALQEKQLDAMERMENINLSVDDRAKAAKEALDLQEKIEAAEKRAAQEAEESAAEIARLEQEQAKAQQAIAEAEAKVAAEEDRQAFEKLTPQEKLESLQGKQAELFKKSEQARDEGDPLAAAEARLDALKMNDEIDAAKQAVKDEEEDEEEDEDEKMAMPAQVSSSLGAVGGGGGTFVGFDLELAEAKAQTRLLEKIAANTASGQGVTKTNGEFF